MAALSGNLTFSIICTCQEKKEIYWYKGVRGVRMQGKWRESEEMGNVQRTVRERELREEGR